MRYRREEQQVLAVAQLAGLLTAAALTFAGFRQALSGVFTLLVVGAVLLIAGAVVYRLLAHGVGRPPRALTNRLVPGLTVDAPSQANPASCKPPTTDELIQQLRSIDWFQFEQVVALLYSKQGYTVTRRGGANRDGGIDLVIEKDGTRTAIQCKHWKTWNVGVKAVRELLGALTDARIQKGTMITLRGYTGDAKHLADKHGIEVVNETGLVQMLEATEAGSNSSVLEILSDTRKLCPKCEQQMVLRTATKGPNAGNRFWGCSGYPRCRYVMAAPERQHPI